MPPKFSREVGKSGAIMKSNKHHRSENSSSATNGLNPPAHGHGGGGMVGTRSASSSGTMSSQRPPHGGGLNLPPPSFTGTLATRSVASASNASSIPPPPATTTLQRAGYIQTAPGAQQFPGSIEPDDGTIIIGEGSGQSSYVTESSPVQGLISARPIHSSTSFEPITASVYRIPERDIETSSAPVQGLNAQYPHNKAPVTAEPMGEEEDKPKPFWKDWNVICCILVLFVLAIGLGVGLAIGMKNTSNISSSLPSTTGAPTQAAVSSAPSPSPTLEFENSPDINTCETVREAEDVENQESMTVKRFSLDLDVVMIDPIQVIAPFLEDIRFELLQDSIAPEIAQCYEFRRKLERRLDLLDRFVVGNAIFESVVSRSNSACSSATTENCFPVLSRLAIYLKDDLSDNALTAHVTEIFSGGWDSFDAPFKRIELTGLRLYTAGDFSGPTPAPSYEEDKDLDGNEANEDEEVDKDEADGDEQVDKDEADGDEQVDADEADGNEEVDADEAVGDEQVDADEADGNEEVDADEVDGDEQVDADEADGNEQVDADEADGDEQVDADEADGDEQVDADEADGNEEVDADED